MTLQKYKKVSKNYLLLDLIFFIYVFYLKERFSDFKKLIRRQKLLYNKKIVLIKSWVKVVLSLKVKNWTSILILKNVTYISNFLLILSN